MSGSPGPGGSNGGPSVPAQVKPLGAQPQPLAATVAAPSPSPAPPVVAVDPAAPGSPLADVDAVVVDQDSPAPPPAPPAGARPAVLPNLGEAPSGQHTNAITLAGVGAVAAGLYLRRRRLVDTSTPAEQG